MQLVRFSWSFALPLELDLELGLDLGLGLRLGLTLGLVCSLHLNDWMKAFEMSFPWTRKTIHHILSIHLWIFVNNYDGRRHRRNVHLMTSNPELTCKPKNKKNSWWLVITCRSSRENSILKAKEGEGGRRTIKLLL